MVYDFLFTSSFSPYPVIWVNQRRPTCVPASILRPVIAWYKLLKIKNCVLCTEVCSNWTQRRKWGRKCPPLITGGGCLVIVCFSVYWFVHTLFSYLYYLLRCSTWSVDLLFYAKQIPHSWIWTVLPRNNMSSDIFVYGFPLHSQVCPDEAIQPHEARVLLHLHQLLQCTRVLCSHRSCR